MVGTKYSRAAIFIIFGFIVIIITSYGNENINKKTIIQINDVIDIVFEEFSKIKENMSHLNGSYLCAEEFAEDKDLSTTVPRILHFLWIVQIIPDKYLEAITEFEEKNPDYQIFFWTDNNSLPKVQSRSSWTIKDVNSLNLTIPDVIDGENESAGWGWIGAKSDLLRYEIVYQYGGIYLDTDSKSLESFGPIFQESFVCYVSGYNTLDNSVFGMPVGSKFLRFVLESAKLNFQLEEFKKRIVYLRYGPTFLGKMFFKFNDERINIIDSRYLIFNYTNSNYMIQTNDQSWGGRR